MSELAAADRSAEVGPMDDAELVVACQSGNEAAFGELVRRHQIAVFRVLLGLLGDADTAEPLCEKVFVRAARELDGLANPAAFGAWVLGLARAEVARVESEQQSGPRIVRENPGGAPRNQVKHEVREALLTLRAEQRLLLVLTQVQREAPERVAEVLGVTVAELDDMIQEARRDFADALRARAELALGATEQIDAPARPGDVIQRRFRVIAPIGRGGFGAVYRALDLKTEREVAVKVLLPSKAQMRDVRRRFEREARLIAKVKHPAFASIVDYGSTRDGLPYIAMELVEGSPLSALLEGATALDAAEALTITDGVLEGLEHAHSTGIVHRDLKPENVMVVDPEARSVKILDLGISKVLSPADAAETKLTAAGQVFGTPAYMAPEQALGEEIDGRADLYSVTVVLYEMLSGRPPFQAANGVAMMALHLAQAPPPLAEVAPRPLSPALQALVSRGLAKRRDERFADAGEFRRAVGELIAEVAPTGQPRVALPRLRPAARSSAAPTGALSANDRQQPWLRRAALLALALAVIVALGLIFLRS